MLSRSCLRVDLEVARRLRALATAHNYKHGEDRRWTEFARKAMELGLRELEREMGVSK